MTVVLEEASARLGHFPTPLQPLYGVSDVLGGAFPVLAKRDDLCGLGAGGNKVRKLRWLLSDAVARGATVILTTGGLQSNHCALTALCAAQLGLPTEQFLAGPAPAALTGNLRLSSAVGVTTHFGTDGGFEAAARLMRDRAAELAGAGETPVVLPLGGSTALGSRGLVDVITELAADPAAPAVSDVVAAAGSMGTMAGLVLGTWVHDLPWTVHGHSVLWLRPEAEACLERLLDDLRESWFPDVEPRRNWRISDAQLGTGYGAPTAAGAAAARLLLEREGVVLDATYTAKAMAGLLADHADGLLGHSGATVFYHSGGLAGYFA